MTKVEAFDEKLVALLKKKSSFLDLEGDLHKQNVINAAWNVDATLIRLLLKEKNVKEKFFTEIDKHWVFNIQLFVDYLSQKNFLNDSYTKYKNKIGLTIGEKYLTERNEVALVWPFKDCVLEGGQSTEEQDREEIFFNEVLAQDEIDKLFDPKVLTNGRRYSKDGEKQFDGFTRVEDGTIKDNLIVKGNNLLALHTLKQQFAGKVKLIYIDPPYNTGNDGFKYNDRFNHSTWLTFMRNRLEIARELLRDDGHIFVHCDNNEQAYLRILLDQIFDKSNFIELITVVNNPRGRDYGGIANMHEFINVYQKSDEAELYLLKDKTKEFPYKDKISGFEIRELRNRNSKFNDKNRPNLFYPFYLDPKNTDENGFHKISLEKKKGWVEVVPAKSEGIQTVWRWGKKKSKENLNINICGKAMKEKGRYQIVEKYRKNESMCRSVWWDKEVNSERGSLHLKKMFKKKAFIGPKPEETLKRVLDISTKKSDIVLDFFAGSGTTGAVAHKMNRQYIMIEQMDYITDLPEARIKKVVDGEQGGISKDVNWKGGGSFVYMELKKYNEAFIDDIKKAKDTKALLKIWEEMKEKSFLSWNVDLKQQEEAMEEFKKLSLAKQKEGLVLLLNKNQLYVNMSDIEDKTHGVTAAEKRLSKEFY